MSTEDTPAHPSRRRRAAIATTLVVYAVLSLPFDLPRWPATNGVVEHVRPLARAVGTEHSFRFFADVSRSTFDLWAEVELADGTTVEHHFALPPAAWGTYGNTDRFLLALAYDDGTAEVQGRTSAARAVAARYPGAVEVRLVRREWLVADPTQARLDIIHTEEL